MIIQKMKQGDNEIRIESAESIEDARKHGFKIETGEYTRYFVNNKPVSSYMTLMKFIVEETKKNKNKFVPDEGSLSKARRELLLKYNEDMKKQIQEIKLRHGHSVLPKETIKMLDSFMDKIDESGMRIKE